ncbi:MAG: peptidoglycan binding domain-containing protein [candidate division NC10 bacterium CSP1-5]|nr:MAG: peptidoglycan binding domain-containing protein [candidate division NC10 bacterium CSP1-5]
MASLRIESPADVAARAAPPTPSPILVPVEERVLNSNIVTRGTARFGLPQPISIVPSALKAKAGLITTLPLRNTQLREGGVILTASGRPVFVLQGTIPAYRDLVPGMSGDDVRQLEQGLNRLRFDPGPVDGTYDERTSAAVTQWYTSAGFEPFGPTPDQLAAAAAAAAARRAVDAARARAEHANKAAAAEIQAMIAERALIVLDPRQPETARAAAEAKLELARAAARKAQLEGELEVQAALDAQEAALRNAKLAADRVDRLAADVDIAKRTLGVQVPADEIVFIPTLPARVQEVTALVGHEARGPVMSVTDNQLVIDSALPLDAAPLVKPGMPVAIDEQALGIKATGVVTRVADTPGTHGVDGYHIYFEVRVDKTPTRLEGFSLRLTIPIKSTKGVVTVVPLSALSLAADGTSRVQVARDGALEYIVVKPGLSADGFVEVTPVNGPLAPGQLVVVGYKNPENRDLQ